MELDHLAALETLCMVCGGRLKQFKQSFQCSDKRSTERLASVDVVTELCPTIYRFTPHASVMDAT